MVPGDNVSTLVQCELVRIGGIADGGVPNGLDTELCHRNRISHSMDGSAVLPRTALMYPQGLVAFKRGGPLPKPCVTAFPGRVAKAGARLDRAECKLNDASQFFFVQGESDDKTRSSLMIK